MKQELETELLRVLDELRESAPPPAASITLSDEQIKDLLIKLKPMLLDRDTGCIYMLDEIRAIPGAEELARQIDEFELREASETLERLMEDLGLES